MKLIKFFLLGLSINLIAIATIVILQNPIHSSSLESSTITTNKNTERTKEQDIWTQMRENTGYVVLLRHAQTVPGTGDPPGFQLDDCTTQRNLSEVGKEQAIRIGKAFRDRNIPLNQILSSQYCRCLDTARLLNLGKVNPSPMLNSIFEDRTTATQQNQEVRQEIFNHRNTPGVIVMVSHFANISEISGISPQSGEAVVVQVNQQRELEVVGQIQE
ncbi:MAG: histidine phosphatase family protein [Waterburya sp.]